MNIQLFYCDGCPSYQRAIDKLREVLRLEALTDPTEIVLVTTGADAHAKRLAFCGTDSAGAATSAEHSRLRLAEVLE